MPEAWNRTPRPHEHAERGVQPEGSFGGRREPALRARLALSLRGDQGPGGAGNPGGGFGAAARVRAAAASGLRSGRPAPAAPGDRERGLGALEDRGRRRESRGRLLCRGCGGRSFERPRRIGRRGSGERAGLFHLAGRIGGTLALVERNPEGAGAPAAGA